MATAGYLKDCSKKIKPWIWKTNSLLCQSVAGSAFKSFEKDQDPFFLAFAEKTTNSYEYVVSNTLVYNNLVVRELESPYCF